MISVKNLFRQLSFSSVDRYLWCFAAPCPFGFAGKGTRTCACCCLCSTAWETWLTDSRSWLPDHPPGCWSSSRCHTTVETSLQAVAKGLQSMSYNNRDFTAGCYKGLQSMSNNRLHWRLLQKDYNQCLTTAQTSLQDVAKGLQSMSYNSRFHCRLFQKDYTQCHTTETSLQAVSKGLQSMSYNTDFTAGCCKRITINELGKTAQPTHHVPTYHPSILNPGLVDSFLFVCCCCCSQCEELINDTENKLLTLK